jgi:hypothetical protein
MTVRERVLVLLDEVKPLRYCDDCIAARLGLAHRQQVRKACTELADDREIDRHEAYCSYCHGMKLTSRFLVAPASSPAPESKAADSKSLGAEPVRETDSHTDFAGWTSNERDAIAKVSERVQRLRLFFAQNAPPAESATPEEWFGYLARFKDELGNFNNDVSLMATLMAKQYLEAHLDMVPFDAAKKAQGAPGLDIDQRTRSDERVVAEIKTTHPYKPDDLGAKQAESFMQDDTNLASADAQHKFFFVADSKTFEVLKKPRYRAWFHGVKVVLLPSGDEI